MIGLLQSNKFLSEFINLSPQCISIVTIEDGTFIEINSNFESLLGIRREEIIGSSHDNLGITYNSSIADNFRNDAIENGILKNREASIILRDGTVKYVRISGKITDIDGKTCFISFVDDITEEKKNEAENKDIRNYYSLFFSQTLEGIFFFMLDKPIEWNENANKRELIDYVFSHQKIVSANDAFLDQYGIKLEQALEMTPSDFFSHDIEYGKEVWIDFFNKGRLQTDTEETRSDGKTIIIEGDYICLYDSSGRITGSFGIQRDITSKKISDTLFKESEEKYKYLFENNPHPMWIYDADTLSFLMVNNTATVVYGYSGDEFLKMNLKDIRPKEDWLSLEDDVKKTPESLSLPKRWRHIKKSGELIYVEISSFPINFEGKRARLVLSRDVTDRVKAEDTLLKLSSAVNQSIANIVITNKEGIIEYVNPSFTMTTGFSREDAIGKTPAIVSSGKQSSDFYRLMWETILDGRNWHGEIINKKKNGEYYWERITISPIIDLNGEISNFVGIKEDITKQNELIEELIHSKNKAEESDRIKSTFLATMSHELRTPLNAIIGFSDLLSEDISKDEIDSYALTIHKSGKHLLGLIEEIFDISLIEAGEIKLQFNDAHVLDLLNEILAIVSREQILLGKNDISLKTNFGTNSDNLRISTDIKRFKQILVNLLKNALKFTNNGYIEFGFTLEVIQNKEFVKFYVKDTGIGIALEKQKLIFEQFRQADDSLTRTYGGTGLGLSISKKLVELLGGNIWLNSESGVGTTFYFTLPTGKIFTATNTQDSKPNDTFTYNFSGKKILLAEDDDPSYFLLTAMLRKTGVEIVRANNGNEAVSLSRNEANISLILMDINMPEMNGYDATKIIKSEYPNIPIIAQTAYSISGDKERSIETGCDDYISKPIKKDELFRLIQKYI